MPFASFIGNARVVDRLRSKLQQGRFPHGLIFSGPDGVGKRTFARMVAKALNCAVNGPIDFCDACPQCLKINAGTHADVMNIGIEEDATRIKIAQIRHARSFLDMRPLEGRTKVFIIDPANMMNPESSNALLKGLEEPPENSVFILIAVNVQELLLTVRSRCQGYHFAPLTLDEIRSQNIADELVVRWSQGSLGRARTLDAAAIKEQRSVLLDFIEAAVGARDDTYRDMIAASAELGRARQDFSSRISVMAVLLADLIYISEGATDRLVNIDIRKELEGIAAQASSDRWVRMGEFLRIIEGGIKGNVNRQLMTDVLALTAAAVVDDGR